VTLVVGEVEDGELLLVPSHHLDLGGVDEAGDVTAVVGQIDAPQVFGGSLKSLRLAMISSF
jgi:hypothetical protein